MSKYLQEILIPCIIYYRPPEGCLQWYTGIGGALKSFNGGHDSQQMIKNQNYDICIRSEAGINRRVNPLCPFDKLFF